MAGLALVVAAAAGGIAYAEIPDSAGAIHGCYSPNGAKQNNGSQLNIVDCDLASCNKNQAELTWNQTGPPGADGVSVTSTLLAAGDATCPYGGSQFTADGNNVTYACNGAKGDTGDPGPSDAYTNYGDRFHDIAAGNTQTMASVTVPAGSYTLSGVAHALSVDDFEFAQCFFLAPGATVHGWTAVLTGDGVAPMLADVTLASSTSIFLRCNVQNGTVSTAGQMIATRVGSVTASE